MNRRYPQVRARVEHVFGFCEQSLHRMGSRLIGRARNAAFNLLTALMYNICHYEKLLRLQTKN